MGQIYGDRWELTGRQLGSGGQSHVFCAVDRSGSLTGEYALKRVLNPKRIDRFRSEIEAIKRLNHPNIIKLIDHSALDDEAVCTRPFLVMPVADGGDLSDADRLSLYKGSIDSVLQVSLQLADALKAAHAKGIIHRDVKPANILFTGLGHNVVLTDFGICLIRELPRSTDLGEIMGPRSFIAPELDEGGRLDATPAADVYSFGKLIFYMISGGLIIPRERKRAYIIADNKIAQNAGWDQELLATELRELIDLGFEVELTGFDLPEIDILITDAAAATSEPVQPADERPAVGEHPVTQLGDRWSLGRHVLLCGDSKAQATIDALMGDERADMLFTDYGA